MPALTPDILAKIDRLELAARQVVEGALAGRHRSPRHGFAVEFAQHREYAPGDDIRHVDWKVFARTDRYTIKQYEQETNLVAWLVVDGSESMRVGTVPDAAGYAITKYDAACTLAAALAHLVTRQADTAGLVLYADRVRTLLRPSGQSGQVRDIIRTLAAAPPSGEARTGPVLRDAAAAFGRRGVVFLFSDLLDDVDDLVGGLRVLKSQKHDVSLFQVLDAAEVDFAFRQPTLFRGLEGLPEVTTDPPAVRDAYLAAFGRHQTELAGACRTLGIDLTPVRTDADLGAALAAVVRARGG